MVQSKKGRKRIMVLIIGLIIISGYVVIKTIQIRNVHIGKVVDINFQNGNADYLEMLLKSENKNDPKNKLILFDREAVEQLIQYMRDNNVSIVPGDYKIPQTSTYKELLNILEFESFK